jgi:ribonuclease-3
MTDDPRTRARTALLAHLTEACSVGAELSRLDEALTHPSYANETGAEHNQRLEFLGDAVLGLCVSEWLSKSYPDADEGLLSRMRSTLVNAEALAEWALRLGIPDALLLGRGAQAERLRTNVLADAVEAVVAAVYDAGGMNAVRPLVAQFVVESGERLASLGERDPKSAFQEAVQGRGDPAPTYRVTSTRGPLHAQLFEVEVCVRDEVVGRGNGPSKKLAERAAARDALSRTLGQTPATLTPSNTTDGVRIDE